MRCNGCNYIHWFSESPILLVNFLEEALTHHSKLRPIYPMPKLQKNYTRQDIKTEGSLICIKAREAKKMGSCLASKGLNGQKLTLVYGKKT